MFILKHFLYVILFRRMFSLIQKKKLNSYVLRLGNYKISKNKCSYNVFSGTGAKNGGIAHIHIKMLVPNLPTVISYIEQIVLFCKCLRRLRCRILPRIGQ